MTDSADLHAESEAFAQARFEAALDTDFHVMDERGEPVLVLRLVEVNPRPAPKGYEQFSALFRAPSAAPLLPQATYAMRHAAFGDLPLFIVPIGRDDDAATYEACVVRRVSPRPGAPPT